MARLTDFHRQQTASPMYRRNEMCLYHKRLSTTSIRNGHQTTTITTTSHRSREMTVSLGP
jgi:hypothetical protein